MKRKRLAAGFLAVAIATSAMLAGCGGSDSSMGTAAETTTAKQSGGPAEKVKLDITWWGGEVRHQYTQELLDMYSKEHPEVTFSATPTSWDGYFEKLATQAAGGSMPDIAQMDYLYITTYANNKTVADLTPFIQEGTIDVSHIDESLTKSAQIAGIQSGIPLSTSILTFTYNPSVLKEAGLEAPTPEWTWADFEKYCLQIKEKTGKYGFAQNYSDTNMFNYWLRQHGQTLFSTDNKKLAYDNDQLLVDFIDIHKRLTAAGTMPTPDEWVAISANSLESGPIPTNKAGFNYSSNTYAEQVSKVNDTIQLITPPVSKSGEKALWLKPGMYFCVASTASEAEKKAAAAFVSWFVNNDEAAAKVGTERGIPASSTARDFLSNGNLTNKQKEMFDYYEIAAQLSGECPPPDPQGISEINKLFSDTLDTVMYDKSTSKEAAAEFRAKANEILARNNK